MSKDEAVNNLPPLITNAIKPSDITIIIKEADFQFFGETEDRECSIGIRSDKEIKNQFFEGRATFHMRLIPIEKYSEPNLYNMLFDMLNKMKFTFVMEGDFPMNETIHCVGGKDK